MTCVYSAIMINLFIALMFLTGCEQLEQASSNSVLKVLAGSELKDIEPMLETIKKQTGVTMEMHYIGTLDGAEKIVSGREHYDLAWFSHAKYFSLLQDENKIIHSQEKIALSPVIPAVKTSLAQQWGWVNNPDVTWSQIAEKIKMGEFKYAMTDPTASNSGFSTVMSVQAALSNAGDALTAEDIDADKLKSFFSGQSLTSGSSGWLSEAYIRDQNKLGGLFNYESVLMKMNRSGELQDPLTLIYPKEGMVTADYPLILLAKDKIEPYQQLVAYLKSAEFQTWMMTQTDRRPVNTTVALSDSFPKGYLMDLPFPTSITTVNEILFTYLDDKRKPSHSYFVLDLSGSMGGDRLVALKQAMVNLSGGDSSITGQFARFRNREQVTFLPFNQDVIEIRDFSIGKNGLGMQKIQDYINSLKATGGTGIYSSLKTAYQQARLAIEKDPERFYSIVLMSDGISNEGLSYQQFEQYYRQESDYLANIRTFPVLFGEADQQEMDNLARLTGGRVFDSRKDPLSHVFKKIRGYQ